MNHIVTKLKVSLIQDVLFFQRMQKKEHHERGDHNHILKRIAGSTRECRYQALDPEVFDRAMLDPMTGLSHAALTGQRPQSVEDAERLLSYHVAASMQKK